MARSMNLYLLSVISFVCIAFAGNVLAEKKPNVVVILADDIGVGDISYYTEQFTQNKPVFKTPNIDELAQKGIWFTDAHSATALCAPTRYAVMSGKNNYRSYAPWGVWGSFQPKAITDDEQTLGTVTKQAGYHTGFIGKWHLGGDFKLKSSDNIYRGTDEGALPQVALKKMVGGGPNNLGFDYSFMLPDGIQGPLYLAYENQYWYPLKADSKILHLNEDSVSDLQIISDKGDGMGDSGWNTAEIGDLLSQKAVDFVNKQSKDTPFFLYYASPMAHLPHIPPSTFDDKKVAGATPSPHLDMIYELDLQIGRIVKSLKDREIFENTLIIFTSDNGGLTYRVPGTLESGHQPSGNFRGSKNAPHEGGHRVPFIAVWPDKIKDHSVKTDLVLVQDILATIAAAASGTVSRTEAPDSNNLLPLLTKQDGFQPRHYALLQGGSRNELIYREGPWKLILSSDRKLSKFEPTALFNLVDNVTEQEKFNLINGEQYTQKANEMLTRYLAIRNSAQPTAP